MAVIRMLHRAFTALSRATLDLQSNAAWNKVQDWFTPDGGKTEKLDQKLYNNVKQRVLMIKERLEKDAIRIIGGAGNNFATGGTVTEGGIKVIQITLDPPFFAEGTKTQVDIFFHECVHACLYYGGHYGVIQDFRQYKKPSTYHTLADPQLPSTWVDLEAKDKNLLLKQKGKVGPLPSAALLRNPDTWGAFLAQWDVQW